MAMTGTLAEVSLADLIQVVCQERHTARLTVENESGTASIYIDNGEIAHAASGALEGRDALHRALAWSHGNFRLDNGIKTAKRTIEGSTGANLLEGMVRVDNARAQAGGLRSVDAQRQAQPRPYLQALDPPEAAGDGEASDSGPDTLRRLQEIPFVEAVVLAHRDGVALRYAPDGQSEEDGALTAFLGNAGLAIGKALRFGELRRITADLAGTSRMILPNEGDFAGFHLTETRRQSSVALEAEEILGQHR